jgi:hypothetical protein
LDEEIGDGQLDFKDNEQKFSQTADNKVDEGLDMKETVETNYLRTISKSSQNLELQKQNTSKLNRSTLFLQTILEERKSRIKRQLTGQKQDETVETSRIQIPEFTEEHDEMTRLKYLLPTTYEKYLKLVDIVDDIQKSVKIELFSTDEI